MTGTKCIYERHLGLENQYGRDCPYVKPECSKCQYLPPWEYEHVYPNWKKLLLVGIGIIFGMLIAL